MRSLQAYSGVGNIWAAAVTKATGWLGGILFANCDGPVAIDQIAVTGADLMNWTLGRRDRGRPDVCPSWCMPIKRKLMLGMIHKTA